MLIEANIKFSDPESDDNTDTNSPNSIYTTPDDGDGAHLPSTSDDFLRESAPSPDPIRTLDELETPEIPEEFRLPEISDNRRLINIGNSCYINSALQALATCPEFRDRVDMLAEMNGKMGVSISGRRHRQICEDIPYFLGRLARRPWDKRGDSKTYLRQIKEADLRDYRRSFAVLSSEFETPGQKDVHEYLTVMLGFFDDLVKKFMEIPDEFRDQLKNPTETFTSIVEISTVCEECHKRECLVEERVDLLLGIRPDTDIQTLISEVYTWTTLEKRCDSAICNNREVTCYQGTRMVELPEYLIVTLPRFSHFGEVGKNQCVVDPSFEIDLEVLRSFSMYPPKKSSEYPEQRRQKGFDPLNRLEDVQSYLDNFVAVYNERNVEYHLTCLQPSEAESFRPGTLISVANPEDSLYRSISFWLLGDESAANCEFQTANLRLIENNMESFCNVPDVEIVAMATLLNVDIHVFANETWHCISPVGRVEPLFEKRKSSIYLELVDEMYSPVISVIAETEIQRKKRKSDEVQEEIIPRKRMRFESASQNEFKKPSASKYTLTAAVCHQGSDPMSGHYVAYVKEETEGWMYCSDEYIRTASEHSMLQEISTDGYVFFYRKISD